MKKSYSEKLRDTRWQKRRLELLNEANWKCEECNQGQPEDGLQVHHIFYIAGRDPWEYPDELLMVLCDPCHKNRQDVEQQFFINVAKVIRWKSADELKTFPVWYMFSTKSQAEDNQEI